MTRDDVLALCASLPAAAEDYPFGEGVAVFKIGGRIFALVPLEVVANLPRAVRDRLPRGRPSKAASSSG